MSKDETSNGLTLAAATTIVKANLDKGRQLGCKPLTVAVLDSGSHLVALNREDGASTMRPQLAIGKAAGALGLGVSSRKIAVMAEERPQFVNALGAMSGGRLIPAAGGVLIKDTSDRLIGAVGITGDTSDRDEACALHGIAAAGFSACE